MRYLRFFLAIALCSISIAGLAQSPAAGYLRMYAIADSLDKIDSIHTIDPAAFKIADSLSVAHPSAYFQAATSFINKGKYDEAAFVYFVGYYRYSYYNSVNPDYEPSGDGALLASFSYTLGEPIGMYLMTNVSNYIAVLTKVKIYLEENDYTFFPKTKDPAKFEKQISDINKALELFHANRAAFAERWETERINFEEFIREYEENYRPDRSIPASDEALVVRTDLSDGVLWQKITLDIISPDSATGFMPVVAFVEKPDLKNWPPELIVSDTGSKYQWSFIFIADSVTMTHPEHPLLCVGLKNNSGKMFRLLPSAIGGVENNLSISNMDFDDFLHATEPDGIFRGFKKGK